jgi:GNAT superfamily N-acetyltransferase
MDDVQVRPAVTDDAEILFSLQRESALAAYRHVFPPERYPFPDEEMRAHWRDLLADRDTDVLIAERAGRPVGMVAASPGWLQSLFVVPDEWGRGAGARLHDAAVELLRQHATDAEAEARLWVLEANERARRFYERRGWRPDGERRPSDFPPHPPAVRYALELRAGPDPSQTPTHPGE